MTIEDIQESVKSINVHECKWTTEQRNNKKRNDNVH